MLIINIGIDFHTKGKLYTKFLQLFRLIINHFFDSILKIKHVIRHKVEEDLSDPCVNKQTIDQKKEKYFKLKKENEDLNEIISKVGIYFTSQLILKLGFKIDFVCREKKCC